MIRLLRQRAATPVAATWWRRLWPPTTGPLGKDNPAFWLEQVKVPIFGPEAGIPFPRFGQSLGEGVTKDSFISEVEEATVGLVGKISEREYTSRMAVAGTMPRLN